MFLKIIALKYWYEDLEDEQMKQFFREVYMEIIETQDEEDC